MKVVGGFVGCWIGSALLLFITTLVFVGVMGRTGTAPLSVPLTVLGIFELLVGAGSVLLYGWLIRDVPLGAWRYVAIGGLTLFELITLGVMGFATLLSLNR